MTPGAEIADQVVFRTAQFKRDWKRCLRTPNLVPGELVDVVRRLARRENLDPGFRDHALAGRWRGQRECHIRPDWLLIYLIAGDELRLVRTGTHAELFGR